VASDDWGGTGGLRADMEFSYDDSPSGGASAIQLDAVQRDRVDGSVVFSDSLTASYRWTRQYLCGDDEDPDEGRPSPRGSFGVRL